MSSPPAVRGGPAGFDGRGRTAITNVGAERKRETLIGLTFDRRRRRQVVLLATQIRLNSTSLLVAHLLVLVVVVSVVVDVASFVVLSIHSRPDVSLNPQTACYAFNPLLRRRIVTILFCESCVHCIAMRPQNCHLCITFFLDTPAVLTLKGPSGRVL